MLAFLNPSKLQQHKLKQWQCGSINFQSNCKTTFLFLHCNKQKFTTNL